MQSSGQHYWHGCLVSTSRLVAIALAGIAAALPATAGNPGFGPDTDESEHPAEAIVAQKCVMCHDLLVVTSRRASYQEWKEIFARMVTYGAQVSDAEIESIIDYLSTCNGSE
jgi:hypothetical protein